jgi:hypothetical protein
MAEPALTKDSLKAALKEALSETLREEPALLREAFAGALEDLALAEAIREGRESERVDRSTIFRLLGQGP